MRPARRLIAALLCLAAFDRLIPGLLRQVEHGRYEGAGAFRFGNSDLFGLGPLVAYLREHPGRVRPRALFLGNSVLYGFGLTARDAVPGRYQARHPDLQVFNAAVNGFDLGSNYLVAKALVDSVDRVYVMRGTAVVHPLLASLIPVDAEDAAAFQLQTTDPWEARLRSIASVWQLYASTYRLQAGLFGTSTREYLHRLGHPPAARGFAAGGGSVELTRPRSGSSPTDQRRGELQRQDPLLWRLAELLAAHHTRGVVLQIGAGAAGAIGDAETADFNAAFAPYVEIVRLTIAPALLFDGRHLTPDGARQVAEALP